MSPPLLKKCCICVPLRRGLLVWGYAKMVMSFLILLSLTMTSVQTATRMSEYDSAVIFIQSVTTAVAEVFDLAFTIVLIVATHKKNLKMMQVYYYYSITMLAIYLLILLLTAFNSQRFHLLYNMIFQYTWVFELDYYKVLILGVWVILVQAYLMLIVRAEVYELFERTCIKEKIVRQKSSATFKVIGTLPPPKPATEVVNITTDI